MGTAILLTLLFTQASLAGLPGPYSKESAELRIALQRPVHDYSVAAGTFADALVEVAGRFKIPMGIAWIRKPSGLKPIHLSWNDATVEQVIRDIVHAQPGYEIEVRNAVVHMAPRDMISRKENFLRLRISRFDVQKEVAETASKKLGALVNVHVTPPKPSLGQAKGGLGSSQIVEVGDPEISVKLADATVEDILDAISLASPFKIWLVTFAGDQSKTPGGFRRTVLALTGKPVPDEYQPVWELLKWGRPPY